jgi:DNA-binding MarR family transcriptional regulator
MELEREIRQKAFKNEYIKLAVNILYTGNWMYFIHNRALKPFGLTVQQFNVLRILRGQAPNPCTVNTIMDRMLDKSSNASRIIDRLLMKGLVERRQCEKDRRAVDVLITKKGLDLLLELDEAVEQLEGQMKILDEYEAHTLNVLLDKLRGPGNENGHKRT